MNGNISSVLDKAAGKAQKDHGESLGTFLASLTTSGIILGLGVVIYIFLKSRFPQYYLQQARRISDSEWKLVPLSPRMLFLPMPDPYVQHTSGLDNYFLDRYLHTITRIFLLLGLTIPPILIPMNVVDGKNEAGGVKGLDRLSFSNVGLSHTDRYWAHLAVAIVAVVLVCHILRLELWQYTRVQGRLSASAQNAPERSSILLISNSKQQISPEEIRRHFHKISGGVHNITINRDYSSLHAKLRQRDVLVRRLEAAETSLIIRANMQGKLYQEAESGKDSKGSYPAALWMKYLDQKDRPLTRLPAFPWLPLPWIGPQVDAINYFRTEITRSNLEIEWAQLDPNKFPQTNSAFVHFNQRIPTQLAALALKARIPPTWTLKHGVAPDDIIWHNVSISWWQQCIRTAIVYLLAVVLTLGFAFPVTIIGSLSQVKYLVNVVPWLQWISTLPTWLVAVIQGALPPVMLGVVTAMVPVALRLLANMQGLHSRQATENYVQIYHFTFLFIQGFLTVSLSAGITTILGELSVTIQAVPAVLAQNLPKASNYFFSYIMMYTFTTIVSVLVQVNGLINLCVLSPMFDKTARQKWIRAENLGVQKWGTLIPVFTNIACIGLIYSVIAPLILVFSIICFGALRILYRSYPPKLTELDHDTSGLFYPTAIRQLFAGIYCMELCLAGLFFLVRDADDRATCTAQAIIMIAATVLTALFHYTLDHGHGIQWLSLPCFLRLQMDETGNKGEGLGWRGRKEDKTTPRVKPPILQANLSHDEALISRRPVIWIPKDDLGIADDEIYHVMRANDSIWISNNGASLNEQGKLILWGPPPESSC